LVGLKVGAPLGKGVGSAAGIVGAAVRFLQSMHVEHSPVVQKHFVAQSSGMKAQVSWHSNVGSDVGIGVGIIVGVAVGAVGSAVGVNVGVGGESVGVTVGNGVGGAGVESVVMLFINKPMSCGEMSLNVSTPEGVIVNTFEQNSMVRKKSSIVCGTTSIPAQPCKDSTLVPMGITPSPLPRLASESKVTSG